MKKTKNFFIFKEFVALSWGLKEWLLLKLRIPSLRPVKKEIHIKKNRFFLFFNCRERGSESPVSLNPDKVLEIKAVFFKWAHMVSQFLVVFLWRKFKWNFCLLLWNRSLFVKFRPVILFRELCSGFLIAARVRNPPVILKIVPKAGFECTHWQIDQWEQRKARTEIWCGLRNNC